MGGKTYPAPAMIQTLSYQRRPLGVSPGPVKQRLLQAERRGFVCEQEGRGSVHPVNPARNADDEIEHAAGELSGEEDSEEGYQVEQDRDYPQEHDGNDMRDNQKPLD